MATTTIKIETEIMNHMQQRGGRPREWYVGISADARNRLFTDHCVRENGDAWIYKTAGSAREAREVEQYFINHVGTDGGTGGGDHTAKMVYAYRKAFHTDP